MQIDAGGRVARLPGDVAEIHPAHDTVGNFVRRRIRTGDQRVLAAQLQRQRLERRGSGTHHRAAGGDAADEADLRHLRMRDQRDARVATAGDDVEHARRKNAVPELCDPQRRKRRLVGRLDDERVAGGERGAALACGEEQRMVEGADPADHAQRLAQRVVERAGADRNRAALDLGDESGEVLHVRGADLDVEAHRLERIAGVERLEPGQLVGVAKEDRGSRADRLRPLLRGRVAPCEKRLSRRRDRAIDIVRGGVDGRAQRLPGRRRHDRDRASAVRLMPAAAVVEAAMPRQARVGKAGGGLGHPVPVSCAPECGASAPRTRRANTRARRARRSPPPRLPARRPRPARSRP